MKTTFLISSAIYTKFGVFDHDQRLTQTLQTLTNVRHVVPDAQIFLVESSGGGSISSQELERLSEYADMVFDYSRDELIQQVYANINNADIVKNFSELRAFEQALARIVADPSQFDLGSRMFKLSGRYLLDSNFDLNFYEQNCNYVFAARRGSQFDPSITGGATHQFMSRLWSWPTAQLKSVSQAYAAMVAEFVRANAAGQYLDIEHLLFKQFSQDPLTCEVNTVGVTGNLGPNNQPVRD